MAKSKYIKSVKNIEFSNEEDFICTNILAEWWEGKIPLNIIDLLGLAFKHGVKFERDNMVQ